MAVELDRHIMSVTEAPLCVFSFSIFLEGPAGNRRKTNSDILSGQKRLHLCCQSKIIQQKNNDGVFEMETIKYAEKKVSKVDQAQQRLPNSSARSTAVLNLCHKPQGLPAMIVQCPLPLGLFLHDSRTINNF